jgi:Arc/MetJ-type ribon-helix-helix transcriptional regulator
MDKLQILFPEPQLRRLRSLARRQDRPVSELVRSAVDLWLARHESEGEAVREEAPSYHCGTILADGSDLRELANQDRA